MCRYLILSLLIAINVACGNPESTTPPIFPPTTSAATQPTEVNSGSIPTTTASGLQFKDLVLGTGERPQTGNTAVVHYTGWLLDGTKFDSSLDRGIPFKFVIGKKQVIEGWDEGVGSMNVGGKRELTIPPELAYGDRGVGDVIPPGATLIFEVELLSIQ